MHMKMKRLFCQDENDQLKCCGSSSAQRVMCVCGKWQEQRIEKRVRIIYVLVYMELPSHKRYKRSIATLQLSEWEKQHKVKVLWPERYTTSTVKSLRSSPLSLSLSLSLSLPVCLSVSLSLSLSLSLSPSLSLSLSLSVFLVSLSKSIDLSLLNRS